VYSSVCVMWCVTRGGGVNAKCIKYDRSNLKLSATCVCVCVCVCGIWKWPVASGTPGRRSATVGCLG